MLHQLKNQFSQGFYNDLDNHLYKVCIVHTKSYLLPVRLFMAFSPASTTVPENSCLNVLGNAVNPSWNSGFGFQSATRFKVSIF